MHYHRGDEPRRLGLLAELGERHGAPLVAVNDVHYHAPERRPLLDVVTCIREKCTLPQAGFRLAGSSEINANPKDAKDHPFGVWTLPPERRSSPRGAPPDPRFDHRKYDAIGESDRMTLRFIKPPR